MAVLPSLSEKSTHQLPTRDSYITFIIVRKRFKDGSLCLTVAMEIQQLTGGEGYKYKAVENANHNLVLLRS